MDYENFIVDKSSWKPVKLGTLAVEISERVDNPSESGVERFVGLEHFVSGDLKIKAWGTTSNLTSSTKAFQAGDILFARRNAYLRRASLVDFDGVCSGDAFVLRENHEKLVPGFLAFIVNSNKLWDFANENAAGTMSTRVKWRDLANYEFLLPPKEQQAELAELLWAMDEVIERDLAVLRKTDQLIEVMFSSKNEMALVKGYRIEDLLVEGPTNGFSPQCTDVDANSETVSISAIKNGLFNPHGNTKKAKVENSILEKFNIQSGDVFVVRGNGNKNLCGKAGLAIQSYEKTFYPDLLIRLRFNEKIVIPDFITRLWNSKINHQKLMSSAKSTNGIWKINGKDVKNHEIKIPTLEHQFEIVSAIGKICTSKELIESKIAASKALQKSIINEIF